MTLQEVHQVILEATVGGEAGDIAIDDISLISGPCPASGNTTEAAGNKYRKKHVSLVALSFPVICLF